MQGEIINPTHFGHELPSQDTNPWGGIAFI